MFQIKVSTSANLVIRLLDSTGAPVTGIGYAAVTATAFPNAAGSGSSISVTSGNWLELGGGGYALTYTPGTVGPLVVLVVVSGANDFFGVYDVQADLASDATTAAQSANTNASGAVTAANAAQAAAVQTLDALIGGWTLDATLNQLIIYSTDNITVIAKFNCFDVNGQPSVSNVVKRVKV